MDENLPETLGNPEAKKDCCQKDCENTPENTPQNTPVEPIEEVKAQGPLSMKLEYFDEAGLFVMSYLQGEKLIFQCNLLPCDFEKLTNDMVKTVKNFNLIQIHKYQTRMKDAQEERTKQETNGGVDDAETPDLATAGSSPQSENLDEVHGGQTQAIIPEA